MQKAIEFLNKADEAIADFLLGGICCAAAFTIFTAAVKTAMLIINA